MTTGTTKDNNTVLSVTDGAEFLCVSESIIRRLIKEQRIPFFRIEGRYLLYRPALEEWIRLQIIHPTGKPSEAISHEMADQIWNNTERKQ